MPCLSDLVVERRNTSNAPYSQNEQQKESSFLKEFYEYQKKQQEELAAYSQTSVADIGKKHLEALELFPGKLGNVHRCRPFACLSAPARVILDGIIHDLHKNVNQLFFTFSTPRAFLQAKKRSLYKYYNQQ